MKKKPTTTKDLRSHGSDSEALLNFLRKHWDGLDEVKPKGYEKFCKDYCDFDGMEKWADNERGKQEDEFNGFNDGDDGVNFVSTVSLSHIAYDDTCQGRPPIQMLISACISYGFTRGRIYGKEDGIRIARHEIRGHVSKLLLEI
jgi:hypothetical protein